MTEQQAIQKFARFKTSLFQVVSSGWINDSNFRRMERQAANIYIYTNT